MRAYELMLIVDGDLDEPVAQAWTKTLSDQIAAAGGKVHGSVDWWGKRRFAYEIKHKSEGYYAVFNVTAEPGALDDLERSLRLADDVVRHKLIRLPDAEAARRGLVQAGTTA
jgi:small subunit ribosomal protein S6